MKIILGLALLLVAAGISLWLIPKCRTRLSSGALARLQTVCRLCVRAAEQLFGGGHGPEKKEYVLSLLRQSGYPVSLPITDALIEASVGEMKDRTE